MGKVTTILSILLLIGLVISVCLIVGYADDKPNSFLLYSSKYYSIRYPSNWRIEEDSGYVRFIPQNTDSKLSGFKVFSFKVSFTTEKYTETLIKSSKFYNHTIITSEAATLDNCPAHRLIYTGKVEDKLYKWLRIYTVKENVLYDIGFTFEESKFDNYTTIINEMIKSFKIK